MSKLLEYTPSARLSAIDAMCHPLFDELRVEGTRMAQERELPPLFNFTREGEYPVSLPCCNFFTSTTRLFWNLCSILYLLFLFLSLFPFVVTTSGTWAHALTIFFCFVIAELSIKPELNHKLVPAYCIPELRSRGIDLDNFEPIPLEQLKITLD